MIKTILLLFLLSFVDPITEKQLPLYQKYFPVSYPSFFAQIIVLKLFICQLTFSTFILKISTSMLIKLLKMVTEQLSLSNFIL